MEEKIEQLKAQAAEAIQQAAGSLTELDEIRVKFLGKKGAFTSILRGMGALAKEDRPKIGKVVNEAKAQIEALIAEKNEELRQRALAEKLASEKIDVTLPGRRQPLGHLHPLTLTLARIKDIFFRMGFSVEEGPEIEKDYFNFEALNLPKDHPARDMQDTFYINENVVLRTHTSPCEVRALTTLTPPFRLLMPGRVFRVDEVDASHSPVFHQIEGFVVDKGLTLGDLKGILDSFVHAVFGEDVKTRLRPSYFPFTEPSAELDVSCSICGGKGCRVCKGTGWIEILGCGVTNPHEIANCGYDPKVWTGLAFGLGVDRMANLKFGINDIRLEYENDARFLRQF